MSTKPHILILHPHFTLPGGAGKFVIEISQRLVERGYKVTVVSMISNPSLTRVAKGVEFIDVGGPVTSSFSFWLLYPYWYWRVQSLINQHQPDVLFPQVFPAQWWAFIYKFLHPSQKVVWMCQEPSAFIHSDRWIKALHSPIKRSLAMVLKGILGPIDIWLARQADAVIANSEYSMAEIMQVYRSENLKVSVAHLGVSDLILKAKYQPERRPLAVTVCRLSAFKNVDFLIRTFHQFAQTQSQKWQLSIIGDGEERMALQQLITSLGAEDEIKILGVVGDQELVEQLSHATFYLSAAIDEPFGISIVEAQALGAIAIAHQSGGPQETIIEGKTGYLVKNLDSNEYIAAMSKSLVGSKTRQLSKQAFQHGQTFTWVRTTDEVEQALLASNE